MCFVFCVLRFALRHLYLNVTNHRWGLRLGYRGCYITENPMACDEVAWRSRDGSWWIRLQEIGIQGIRDSLGVQYGTRDYIGKLRFQVDRSLVLNSNSISYILVTAQYFKASLGDTYWTYQGSLPKTPQNPQRIEACFYHDGLWALHLTEIYSQCTLIVNAYPYFYYITTFKIR